MWWQAPPPWRCLLSMLTSIAGYITVAKAGMDWGLIGIELVGIFVGSMIGPRTQKYIPDKVVEDHLHHSRPLRRTRLLQPGILRPELGTIMMTGRASVALHALHFVSSGFTVEAHSTLGSISDPDSVLICLYRMTGNPLALTTIWVRFFWLSSAVVVGELTISVVFRINKAHLDRLNAQVRKDEPPFFGSP